MTIPVLLLILVANLDLTLSQPPAQSPAHHPNPSNITAILEKAGQFSTMVRLLKITQVANQIDNEMNNKNSNQGFTIFAPTDNAFTNLRSGTLNALTDQEKVQLVQFHVVSSLLSTSQFQTVSNPLTTQAGNARSEEFQLNVTADKTGVNLTTGLVNATLNNEVYSDAHLAIYPVDKVLLPIGLFRKSTAPAKAPTEGKGSNAGSPTGSSATRTSDDTSGAMVVSQTMGIGIGVFVMSTAFWCRWSR